MAQSDNIKNQRLQKLAELRAPTHTIAQILGEFGALPCHGSVRFQGAAETIS